jgi:hypothetical protein
MKPEILSDEQIQNWVDTQDANETICLSLTEIAQRAQLDADYKHEQNTVREIFEEMEGHSLIEEITIPAKDATQSESCARVYAFDMPWYNNLKSKYQGVLPKKE